MKHYRFLKRIAESPLTLPVCAVMATLSWGWSSWKSQAPGTSGWEGHMEYLAGWLVCILAAYLLMEINNENQLIRLRTRLVSSVWLVAMGSMSFLHPIGRGGLCALCLAAGYYAFFRCYQRRGCVGETFHCFLLLGVGSLFHFPMALLAVAYFWYMAVFLRALDGHVFLAAIVGLLFPYWIWFCGSCWQQDFTALLAHLHTLYPLAVFAAPSAETLHTIAQSVVQLSLLRKVCWGLFSVIAAVSAIHFLRTRYRDKIRVRMFLYIFVCQFFLLEIAILLFPADFDVLLPQLILSSSPLVAHYLALVGN